MEQPISYRGCTDDYTVSIDCCAFNHNFIAGG